MKYCLKNRRLQEQLDEISNDDFSKQLAYVASLEKAPNPFARSKTIYFSLNNLDQTLLSVEITPDMVKEVNQYDPNSWNRFPDVQPPVGVLMQCEYYPYADKTVRFCATYKRSDAENYDWFDDNECEVFGVHSFRPWGYDEEHQSEEVEDFLTVEPTFSHLQEND